jgi:chromosome segregation ATPase
MNSPHRIALACGLACAATITLAQPAPNPTAARERQQMMQLQQQMQKLRQDNAQLQQGKAQEIEKARAEADQVRREAGQLRASSAGSQREARRLREELDKATQALAASQAEIEKLKADAAQRELAHRDALQAAQNTARAADQAAAQLLAQERRQAEQAAGVLGARLKANTVRADVCEAKHESALSLGHDLLDRYEARQLRACEPFTGLWRVREEKEIQSLRDRLFESRLDVTAASSGSPEPDAK